MYIFIAIIQSWKMIIKCQSSVFALSPIKHFSDVEVWRCWRRICISDTKIQLRMKDYLFDSHKARLVGMLHPGKLTIGLSHTPIRRGVVVNPRRPGGKCVGGTTSSGTSGTGRRGGQPRTQGPCCSRGGLL